MSHEKKASQQFACLSASEIFLLVKLAAISGFHLQLSSSSMKKEYVHFQPKINGTAS